MAEADRLKTLERIIDERIRVGTLHKLQHAYQKGYPFETALHDLVSRIEEALIY
jgi:hypothetical protein